MSENESTETRGLRILDDISSYLASGIGAEDALSGVAGVLCRGLNSDHCRMWIRTPDGSQFKPITAQGYPSPPPGHAELVREWLSTNAADELAGDIWYVRRPLAYEGEQLGLLEATVSDDAHAPVLRQVVATVANVLSPLLASIELSEDLASEVALRTRETEAQRRFTAKIIDSLPVGLYVIDRDYRIQAWNRKRELGTSGVERGEVLGREVFDVLHRQPSELLRQEFDSVFKTGRIEQLEAQSSASGEQRHYRITKVPMRLHDDEITHVITIGEDLTDSKIVERQISQTEKLAALGQLAAGVMHEINNPLATIGACVEALTIRAAELSGQDRSSAEEYLRIIDSELGRCKAIVDGLLDFARPQSRAMGRANVNQVIEDALFLVKHHDRFRRIELVRTLAEDLPAIRGNTEQLIQVFLALMLNAIDAMEGTGRLTVTSALDREQPNRVVVAFEDTGMGIPEDEVPKIFEPFFTTKQPGRGTGLGLSICYGVVQQHGGTIRVESSVGRGSKFSVSLPVFDDGAAL
ncbi:MAG: nitrogen regulation protein NR(II) [Gemmatimonadales bacterium]